MKLNILLLGAVLVLGGLLWFERSAGDQARQELAALEAFERGILPQLTAARARLPGERRTFERLRDRWHTIVDVDTLRVTDTLQVPVTVLVTADSAIRSCAMALTTCQQLAGLERQRADSLARQRDLWRGLARGPWLRPALEVYVWPDRGVAGVVEVGTRRLSLVGRAEIDTVARLRLGVRVGF